MPIFVGQNENFMKKILAILTLVSIVATGVSQEIKQSGLYNKRGKAVVLDKEPVKLNVTLRVVTEEFTPGIYARFAQKLLGQRANLANRLDISIIDGRVATGIVSKPLPTLEVEPYVVPLPVNVIAGKAKEIEAQAAATAEMIFSLRRHRMELISGEAGENVFGAGLKAALDEIARIERECLEMFYGKTTKTEQVYTFNIDVTPEKSEYMVCRFNKEKGIVDESDLSGLPVVIKIEAVQNKDFAEFQPVDPKDVKVSAEYFVVPRLICSLIVETTLLDTISFVSPIYATGVVAPRTK